MKKNVGQTDKIIRTLLAIVLIYLAHYHFTEAPWSYVLYAFGTILILTAIFSYCGLYTVLGKDTCEVKK